jgi:hypothetical protein
MAIARVLCASVEIDPSDIAPVAKRLTISFAGSTSSSGTAGPAGLDLEQAAQGHVPPRLIVDQRRVFLVGLVLAGARRVLQLGDHLGRPHVLFATHPVSVLAAGVEHRRQHRIVAESLAVQADRLFHDLEDA